MTIEPNELKVTYPDLTVKLVGEDGNAFNLIGLVSRAIRKAHGEQAGKDFCQRAMEMPSYEALLVFLQETVNVE